ncbi:hypothetical protein C6497_15335 [Candidatus Poribacteria bacterium]|nr:MAG: hypothetical protein C6497_15335 [Candidatus Poribacteria bacterium]
MNSFWSTIKYYRGINLTLMLCIALATGVLVGSLIVGDSMRGSLQDITLERLGRIHHAVVANHYFDPKMVKVADTHAAIILNGTINVPSSQTRASKVNVFGVDDSFFSSWDSATPNWSNTQNQVFQNIIINEFLRKELNVNTGDSIIVRIPNTGLIHPEFLLGKTDPNDVVDSMRVVISDIITADQGGRFSLNAHQSLPLNVYIPLSVLQQKLGQQDKVNAVFTTNPNITIQDLIELNIEGLRLSINQNNNHFDLQTDQYILSPYIASIASEIASDNNIPILPTFTYLANSITYIGSETGIDENEPKIVPYSTTLAVSFEQGDFADTFNDNTTIEDDRTFSNRQIKEEELYKEKSIAIRKEYNEQIKELQKELSELSESNLRQTIEYKTIASRLDNLFAEINRKQDQIKNFYTTDGIYLNRWTAEDLGVKIGDKVSMSYFTISHQEEYITQTSYFLVKGIIPIEGITADTKVIPQFPGIHETDNISEWNPPFPLDYSLIREKDEEYWDKYKTTPKAFISLKTGMKIWKNRFGELTSIRLGRITGKDIEQTRNIFETEFLKKLDTVQLGFEFIPIRSNGLKSAKGSSDFAMLFSSMSGFIIIAAAVLIGLVFKLGVEQRLREIGILQSMGYTIKKIRRRLLYEGIILTFFGSLGGCLIAVGYAQLLIYGLHTWWLPAIGTPFISLHVRSLSLIIGVVITIAVSIFSIFLAVRKIGKSSIVGQLNRSTVYASDGSMVHSKRTSKSIRMILYSTILLCPLFTGVFLVDVMTGGLGEILLSYIFIGIVLILFLLILRKTLTTHFDFSIYSFIILVFVSFIGLTIGILINFILSINEINLQEYTLSKNPVSRFLFITVGILSLCFGLFRNWLNSDSITQNLSRIRFSFKNIARQTTRSESCVMTISLACCIIVAVGANRQDTIPDSEYSLVAESSLPIHHDLNSIEGRNKLGFSKEDSTILSKSQILLFRLLPGEDISCLNLYKPEKPQILGAPTAMLNKEPWTYLDQKTFSNLTIPAIGDNNSLRWILQHNPKEDFLIHDELGKPVSLRIDTIENSLYQSQLIISETNFLKLFPSISGYQFFLIRTPETYLSETAEILEKTLADFGFDVTYASDRLASFRSVQNTYISTFQSLGGLGLLIGTFGMALVMIRNIIERKGELATLRAFGYSRKLLSGLLFLESSFLLIIGMVIGIVSGLVGIIGMEASLPSFPWLSLSITLLFVLIFGIIANMLAVSIALRSPLISTLKSE